MEIFGWGVLVAASIVSTLTWLFVIPFTLTKYSIGGDINPLPDKVAIIVLGFILFWWWTKVLDWMPFVVEIK